MMNQRPEQLEQLSAYLDGELTDAERVSVERLLAADPAARALLDELRRTAELVAGLPRAEAPLDFAENTVARLERADLLGEAATPVGATRRPWLARGLALAASLALVVTAGWLVRSQLQTEAHKPVAELAMDAPGRGDAAGETTLREQVVHAAPHGTAKDRTLGLKLRGSPADLAKQGTFTAPAATAARTPTGAESTPASEGGGLFGPSAPPDAVGLAAETAPDLSETPHAKLYYGAGSSDQRDARAAERADAVGLDTLLAANVLTNRDLPELPIAIVGRRLVVEADEVAQARVIETVDRFMLGNGIPNASGGPLPEPISQAQAFYVMRPVARAADAPAPATSPPPLDAGEPLATKAAPAAPLPMGEMHVILNVPRRQATALLGQIETQVVRDQGNMRWEKDAAPDLAGGRGGELYAISIDAREKQVKHGPDAEDNDRRRSAIGRRGGISGAAEDEQSRRPAPTTTAAEPGGDEARESTVAPPLPAADMVTLAITLRGLSQVAAPSASRAIGSAVGEATTRPTSQPTTRGAGGG